MNNKNGLLRQAVFIQERSVGQGGPGKAVNLGRTDLDPVRFDYQSKPTRLSYAILDRDRPGEGDIGDELPAAIRNTPGIQQVYDL